MRVSVYVFIYLKNLQINESFNFLFLTSLFFFNLSLFFIVCGHSDSHSLILLFNDELTDGHYRGSAYIYQNEKKNENAFNLIKLLE